MVVLSTIYQPSAPTHSYCLYFLVPRTSKICPRMFRPSTRASQWLEAITPGLVHPLQMGVPAGSGAPLSKLRAARGQLKSRNGLKRCNEPNSCLELKSRYPNSSPVSQP
ncbi:hypothetical protein C8F04DRAFT_1393532 [Mycena alexandri]|uniref:Uncharacterized protein n=1 Tax=Mycena alexandri TaxID=1745969 RepID=A0AAD6X7B8_9AGAR|nr:hypothetical protein C8F04DRAFT_1393532 [Mycena alexandri]